MGPRERVHKSAGPRPHIVIIGAGFGGLVAARELADAAVDITLVDRNNFHTFQPLLYQVATAGLNALNPVPPSRAAGCSCTPRG